ncbi:diguanylate cyclase domain-containing protein [Cupriavidus sp. D384]|uniref:diguanylate cyclase domain-containing protein n=1 Tax=Cupriavidus sp. D384 TaxID=1538095 RepID=UPI000833B0AE|nr:diguanylate cyclase [Cupriavidus sp. D384]
MKTYLRSVRFGLIRTMALGALVTALLVGGGLFVMKRFDSYVTTIYVGNTLPVGQLGELRASCLEARRRLWKALAMRAHGDDHAIVAGVRDDLARMDKAWAAYYPANVSGPREQQAADALRHELGAFRNLALATAEMIVAGHHDAAKAYLSAQIGLMQHMDDLMARAIDANVVQAAALARGSTQMLERTAQAAAAVMAAAMAVSLAFGFRLLRERDDARRSSRYSLWLVDQAFELTQDGMMITDAHGIIEKVNPAFVRLTGYAEAELIGNTPRMLGSGRQPPEFYRDMWQALRETGHWRGELWNRRKDGAIYRESLSIHGIRGPKGDVSNFVAVCADITQRQLAQDRLGYLATHDALTGLPNRTLLGERLEQAIGRARRGGTHVAVMFIDLDGFKAVNDTLGHGIGDETLITVAQRLKAPLRDGDTVARLGGDEFAIVLEDVADIGHVAPLAERLVQAVGGIDTINGCPVSITPSIGIALYPDDAEEPDYLLNLADESMYLAKRSGKNGYCFSGALPRKAA